jgi:hypothetical protein
VVDEVLPVSLDVVQRAKLIVFGKPQLSARDAIHVASMELVGAGMIMTFDRGFDSVAGIVRLR